ncbi:MAG: hypothetical protein ACREFI_02525, partial [Stellaceae bacterium]
MLALSVSKAAARALRMPEQAAAVEVDVTALGAHVHPEDLSHYLNTVHWARHADGQVARSILRLARPDDGWVSVIVKFGPVCANVVNVQIDLDDAAAAQRAEKQIRQIVEGARQAAVVHVGRQVVYSNPALASLMG